MKNLKAVCLSFCSTLLISLVPALAQEQENILIQSADEVLKAVSEIRGLAVEAPIRKSVKSRPEIETYLLEKIESEYPAEEIRSEAALLKQLFLIPEEMDLYDFMINLLTEQVAGVYDPDSKEFFIADWIPLELQRPVIAHELTHALQDQYHDLSGLLARIPGNDDQMLAKSALVEGEALIVMIEYSLKPLGGSILNIPDIRKMTESQRSLMEAQFPTFASAPPYIQETLLFPYTYGASFLQHFLKAGSWEDVERIYSALPESTEQIIHPLKYRENPDRPTLVPEAAVALGKGFDQVHSNVLGEFGLFLVLGRFLDDRPAKDASSGWDGDRVQLFQNSSGVSLLRLESVWDTPSDANEFYSAYSSLIPLKYPGIKRTREESGVSLWEDEDGSHSVRIELSDIRLVIVERCE
jgi:hypothetical protein